jgi:hypothetical protein
VSGPVTYLTGTEHEHTIDPETLHEVPTRPNDLVVWVGRNRRAPVPTEPAAALLHHTELGVAARMVGALSLAERELAAAAELAGRIAPTAALRAGLRLAHVHQWQGRFAEADAEFARCVAAATTPSDRAFAHQHAGKSAYETGDFETAATHFAVALRLREGGDPDLVASSALAVDATDACRTAVAVAAELHRLVPGGHHATAAALRAANALRERPDHLGPLVELRTLLPAGPVSKSVVAELFRYSEVVDTALADLVATGWLTDTGTAFAATPKCHDLLANLVVAMDTALGRQWERPALTATLTTVVRRAAGTSDGPVFDALAGANPRGGHAVRLFELCNTLRHHRADAHAAAWRAAGLSADAVRDLPDDDPVRREIEAATDRVASRPYRPLSTADRAELVTQLGRLPR